MTAPLIAICGTALSGLLMLVVEWLKAGQAQSTGQQIQAASTAEATAKVQTAIAAAVVAAPTTPAAVVDRLKQGAF